VTAIASDDMPDEWGLGDQLHLEVYTRLSRIADLGESSAVVMVRQRPHRPARPQAQGTLSDDDLIDLDNFLDSALMADHTIRRYLGDNYIDNYLNTLEDDND
jgi:hypothetical protein